MGSPKSKIFSLRMGRAADDVIEIDASNDTTPSDIDTADDDDDDNIERELADHRSDESSWFCRTPMDPSGPDEADVDLDAPLLRDMLSLKPIPRAADCLGTIMSTNTNKIKEQGIKGSRKKLDVNLLTF